MQIANNSIPPELNMHDPATRLLYDYWRSSASYRVRIALNLKRLSYTSIPVHLVNNGGEQHAESYRAINPQELIPTLVEKGSVLRQSIAIIEYLDEAYPNTPLLLPREALAKARVRAIGLAIACDIHPLNNARVLGYLATVCKLDATARETWTRHWITLGFDALEMLLATDAATGRFCHGDTPGMADALLIPQIYNARRWKADLSAYPTLVRIDAACAKIDAFAVALPEQQPDAPGS